MRKRNSGRGRLATIASGASAARVSLKYIVILLAVLVPVCVLVIQPSGRATSNTITVNTLDDPGTSSECSLRAAINNANNETSDANSTCAAGTGSDTINFSVGGTITLTSTLPAIANTSPGSLTIDGAGQTVTVDGGNLYRVLMVNAGAALNLNNLTIADASITDTSGSTYGGAGILSLGALSVSNSTFTGNFVH